MTSSYKRSLQVFWFTPFPSSSQQLFPGTMADRKAELEKKRKKLEELKRARGQQKLQAKDKEVLAASRLLASCKFWLVLVVRCLFHPPRVTTWPGKGRMSISW